MAVPPHDDIIAGICVLKRALQLLTTTNECLDSDPEWKLGRTFNERKYIGVFSLSKGRWGVRSKVGGKFMPVGRFSSQLKAAAAYDYAQRFFSRVSSRINGVPMCALNEDELSDFRASLESLKDLQGSERVVGTEDPTGKEGSAIDRGLRGSSWSKQRAIDFFHDMIMEGPRFVCGCCRQLWFRKSVSVPSAVSRQSFEKLTRSLDTPLDERMGGDGLEWLCRTCAPALNKGRSPPFAFWKFPAFRYSRSVV